MVTNHDTWHWQDPGSAWKGVGIYHVTLTIPSREPLLGELVTPDNNPAQAHILHSDLGNAVQGFWRAVKKIGRAFSYLRLSNGTIDENDHLSFFASAESRDNPLRMHIGEHEYRVQKHWNDMYINEFPFEYYHENPPVLTQNVYIYGMSLLIFLRMWRLLEEVILDHYKNLYFLWMKTIMY